MAKAAKHEISFDEALIQLETLIQSIEHGELSLEDSMAAYKKGIETIRLCQSKLASAEQQLQILENNELTLLELPDA